MSRQTADRAVVLGASMAGLLAARVLAGAYARVTVIDRDELPQAATHQRGGPARAACARAAGAGSKRSRNCSPRLTAELAGRGCRPGTCWPTHAGTSAAAGLGKLAPSWFSRAPAGHENQPCAWRRGRGGGLSHYRRRLLEPHVPWGDIGTAGAFATPMRNPEGGNLDAQ